MKSRRKTFFIVICILAIVLIITLIAWAGYLRFAKGYGWADWTGFGSYTDPQGEYYRAKTLWDLLDLFIVSLVLALIAFMFNWSMRSRERESTKERLNEANLQAYLDKMTELLLEKDLLGKSAEIDDPVRNVAQTRTTTILRTLDRARRDIVFQFLHDSGLADSLLVNAHLREIDLRETNVYAINLSEATLYDADLRGANLNSANLSGARMYGANLSEAWLIEADLSKANLSQANLNKTVLDKANLRGAVLDGAELIEASLGEAQLQNAKLGSTNLSKAYLGKADLSEAFMIWANLKKARLNEAYMEGVYLSTADLRGADLTSATIADYQLKQAHSLAGATMPDGMKYDPEIHKLEN